MVSLDEGVEGGSKVGIESVVEGVERFGALVGR